MGLGKILSRQRSGQVENRQAGTNYQMILDSNPLWPTEIYNGAMSIPGAWRASLLISDLLGSVPWTAYRERAGNPVEELSPTPLLLEQPAPPDTRMTTFSSWGLDLVWHGNAIGVIAARDYQGVPTAVYPVPADQVGVRRITDQDYSPLPVGSIEYQAGTIRMSSDEVLHIKGPCVPGGLRGFGVLEAHLNGSLTLANSLSDQAQSVGKHGIPTALLKNTDANASTDDLKKMREGWMATQAARSIQVINSATEFTPLSWNPEELQLVEARKYSLHEMALIFGLPLNFLGADQSSRTYSNIQDEALNLLKYSMNGHLGRFEQTLSNLYPRGTYVKANLDSILRADTLTRYQAYEIALKNNILTSDEVRNLEDRAPLPEKDVSPDEFSPDFGGNNA